MVEGFKTLGSVMCSVSRGGVVSLILLVLLNFPTVVSDLYAQPSPPGSETNELSKPDKILAARDFIDKFLSPEKKKKLEEIGQAAGLSPAEVFLSLTAQEIETLGPGSSVVEYSCRQLRVKYIVCSRDHGDCAAACSESICRSRSPTIGCDVAPKCRIAC
jgi:hypothetical protein